MDQTYLRARAKINLFLDILGKREDGYHELVTIMQSLMLYDGLHVKKIHKPGYLKMICNLPWLPCDEKNLAYRAAQYMIGQYGISEGVFLELRKAIPASAGLGGGSADCAAALVGMRNLFGLPVSNAELIEIGAKFGADVPFCLMRGTVLAQGIGERLTRLPPAPFSYVVLVKPPIAVSTAEIFRTYRHEDKPPAPDIMIMQNSIRNQDYDSMAANMYNALEHVTIARHPIIAEIKGELLDLGADGAMMSGSGPTVFGIFDTRQKALAAMRAMKAAYPDYNEIFLTRFYTTNGR